MKKIIALVLLLTLVLSLVACNKEETKTPEEVAPEATTVPENTTSEVTAQSIYDANHVPTLLEKYDSIYIESAENGEIYKEEYFNKDYRYYHELYDGAESEVLTTRKAYYMYYEDMYVLPVFLTPDGVPDMKKIFDEDMNRSCVYSDFLNDTILSVTEKDGQIIVRSASDAEEAEFYKAQGWTVSEEAHVLDAETLNLISGKGSYTNIESGEILEGTRTAFYNVEMPEKMKKLVEFDTQTENLRTFTVVTNPGAENEKTEVVKAPKGLQIAFSADLDVERSYSLYDDASCTRILEEDWDTESDVTVYVKWDE